MREIIARLQSLSGPDREVDIAICLRLSYVGAHQSGTIENLRRAEPDDDYLDYECHDDGGGIPECTDRAPALTASLDAAVALVERMMPGMTTHLLRKVLDAVRHIRSLRSSPSDTIQSWLARNLCLALFRALEASDAG